MLLVSESFVLKYETFSTLFRMLLKPQKHSAFLFESYQVALVIGGTERYRWLEEVLEENHVYQILPVLYMKKPPWSMTLFFQRMLYWSMFRLDRNTIKKRNMELLPQKREKW